MNLENVLSTFWKSIKSYLDNSGYATKNEVYNLIYPIGSIYLSVNSVDPSTIFGGTWEKIKDRFLLSSGDTYQIGSIGGNSSTTLEISNLPSHNHSGTTENQSANHTHSFSGTTSSNGDHDHNTAHGWHRTCNTEGVHCLSDEYFSGDNWSANKTSKNGSHTHTFSGDTGNQSTNHNHKFTTSSVGSTESFSNMPPYLTINVWKRIA